jgi:hypothetical protein
MIGNAIKEKVVGGVPHFLPVFRVTSPSYSIVVFMQKIDCLYNSVVLELMIGLRN